MPFLRFLRTMAVWIILAGMTGSAIMGYRVYQTLTIQDFNPKSLIELIRGPNDIQYNTLPKRQKPETQSVSGIVKPKLSGALPVGRWACIEIMDFEQNRKTNTPRHSYRCDIFGGSTEVIELREDSSGHVLLVHSRPTPGGFSLNDSYAYYTNGRELRWIFSIDNDDFMLEVQTDRASYLSLRRISDNLLYNLRSGEYLIRIGSPEYVLLIHYQECIETNEGLNLWEVKDCGIPFDMY